MKKFQLAILIGFGLLLHGVVTSSVSAQGMSDEQMEAMNEAMLNSMGRGNSNRPPSNNQANNQPNNQRVNRSGNQNTASSDNAIKVNPLFQLFDTDGNGELSLAEIDAASRLLYRLDANEDDRITADEVEDLVGGGESDPPADPPADPRFGQLDQGNRVDPGAGRMGPPAGRAGGGGGPKIASMGGVDAGGGRVRNGGNSNRGAARMAPPGTGADRGAPRTGGGPRTAGMKGVSNNAGRGAGGASNEDAGPQFEDYDKNRDGVIKRTEISSSRLRSRFKKMDANGDKDVDRSEFDKYMSDPALNGGVK